MCWQQLIGVGAQAGGSALQGEQNASTLNSNADILDLKATDAIQRGGVAEDQQRVKTRLMIGTHRATIGASGVDVNSGSAANLQVQTEGVGEQDAQQIRANAMREAWGYSTEAANLRAQAENQMGMTDLLMPGGRDFQKGLVKSYSTKGFLGPNDWKSADKNRLPWK
jgi:hypothetical protein